MNEMDTNKNLYGLNGWLVLFQIQLISGLAGAVQNIPFVLLLSRDILKDVFVPYFVIFNAAMILTALVCIVMFYKKRMAFRPLFVFYSIVAVVFLALYYFVGMDFSYMNTGTAGIDSFMKTFMLVVQINGLVFSIGIHTALIIALYKSQRVKNTFR